MYCKKCQIRMNVIRNPKTDKFVFRCPICQREEEFENVLGVLGPDMLEEIYYRNKAFTDMVKGQNPRDVDLTSNQWILRNYIACSVELGEIGQLLPFKWWGRGTYEIDKDKIAEELIDLLHFMMDLWDALGLEPKDIYELYKKKNNTNWKRYLEKIGWGKVNK